jgi:uncharacterized OB-fold protein
MLGRGSRPFEGKEYCTVYDHVGNVERHGFIETEQKSTLEPEVRKKKTVLADAPVKICGNCGAACHPAKLKCDECGEEFPKDKKRMHVNGKGELVEYNENSLNRDRFKKDCESFIAYAWKNGHQDKSIYYRLVEKYNKDIFLENVKFYNEAKATYARWLEQGADDNGYLLGSARFFKHLRRQ